MTAFTTTADHPLRSALRSMATRWQRLRSGRGVSLRELDAGTLADIGIDASEIASIDAEWHGHADITRRRIAPRPRWE